jgi:hypothetical protein
MKKFLFLAMAMVLASELSAGTITVTQPAPSDVWYMGVVHVISWTFSGYSNPGNIKVVIRLRQGTTNVFDIAENVPLTQGVYSWAPPLEGIPAGTYSIRVRIPAGDIGDSDEFQLKLPAIEVVAPDGGEAWKQQESHSIQWTSEGSSGPVRISLYQDSAEAGILAPNAPNTGSYSWTINKFTNGNTIGPGQYKVRVASVANSAISGESAGPFTISLFVSVKPPLAKEMPKARPDIVVCYMEEWWVLAPGKAKIQVKVKNVGGSPARSSVLLFYIENKGNKQFLIPALDPGQSHDVFREEYFAVAGKIDYSIEADWSKLVVESDEDNNKASGTIIKKTGAFVAPPLQLHCTGKN